MTAPAPTRPNLPNLNLDELDRLYNNVLVETGKIFKVLAKEGGSSVAELPVANTSRIQYNVEEFNAALDEVESEILQAKAAILRDLNKAREKRNPPPVPVPAPKPASLPAPTAPMAPKAPKAPMAPMAPMTVGIPAGPSPPQPQPGKPPLNKSVAPIPDMGLDLTASPVAKHSPSPKLVKTNPKNSPRPGAARPVSAPPKKDSKAPPGQASRLAHAANAASQAPRPASAAPQAPHQVHNTKSAVLQGGNLGSGPTAPPNQINTSNPPPQQAVPGPQPPQTTQGHQGAFHAPPSATAKAPAPAPVPGAEALFTNMTFSLAPAPGEAPKQNHQPAANMTNATNPPAPNVSHQAPAPPNANINNATGNGAGGEDANMSNAEIFDLGSGSMDNMEDINYDLGGEGGDNSNFNDLYFSSGGDDTTQNTEFDGSNFYNF
ncbi:hypothetical protein GE21DRAFT_1093210 [Neurospora crassa]|nr:hypothetical protein GE21DRAFT_1093210 [Neurospora crassa]